MSILSRFFGKQTEELFNADGSVSTLTRNERIKVAKTVQTGCVQDNFKYDPTYQDAVKSGRITPYKAPNPKSYKQDCTYNDPGDHGYTDGTE